MNPCPCGHLGDRVKQCICSPHSIQRYRGRISGPLIDRIDIHVEVPRLTKDELLRSQEAETSAKIKERINVARVAQAKRFKVLNRKDGRREHILLTNSQMKAREVREFCRLTAQASSFLEASIDKLGLSGRAFERVIKVARTIADLAGMETVDIENIAEAIQYRALDRQYF